ncbi:fos-related antigen 2 [Galendromus occidentalis]|uniref:Fos-related antigen 2 n=1 Tax=Galendromus occidentalis TaxID=34638 RepID=A0AAJ7L7I8_9ACAR|nr:fos-related antigen 2 [Galendromus occidentalis]
MITKMRRRMPSPSSTAGSRCDENLVAVLDEIALGQPLLTDDLKPALFEDEYPGNFTNSTCTTSTLTPTTLRTIGDAFEYSADVPPPLEHQLAAGFAPPTVIVAQQFNNNTQRMQDDVEIKREITEEDAGYVPTPWNSDPVNQQNVDMSVYQTSLPYTTASDVRPQITATPSPRRRNQTNSPPQRETPTKRRIKEEGPAADEDEIRKRQRRERNKLAAARCRQRRVDQTNGLQNEVDLLEDRQKELRNQYEELQKQKKRLQISLDQHSCVHNDVSRSASVPVTSQSSVHAPMGSVVTGLPNISLSQTSVSSPSQVNVIVRRDSLDSRLAEIVPTTVAAMPQQTEKRPRPSTLPMSMFEQTGVPIQTPSAVLYSFEGLVEGTGLTPGLTPLGFSPTCTLQQRNSNGDVSTPDTTPRKLVTL